MWGRGKSQKVTFAQRGLCPKESFTMNFPFFSGLSELKHIMKSGKTENNEKFIKLVFSSTVPLIL